MADLLSLLRYDFVQHALLAGSLAALLGAIVGYFVVIRQVSFAAHALSHIGFAGATGAALFGWSPLAGMLVLTVGSGALMGVTGERLQRSDLAIGLVLSFSLGLGTLFLSLYAGFAGQTTAILFGDILGVGWDQIREMVLLSAASLGALALFSRRLLFASTQPRLAEARGLSLGTLSIAFMIVLAIAVTLASQIVGVLLVFTLTVAPAGLALRLCRTFWSGLLTAILLGQGAVLLGILLACLTNHPTSFWITTLFFFLYLAMEGYRRLFSRRAR